MSFDKRCQYHGNAQSTANTHVQGQRSRAVYVLVTVDSHQGVATFVQRALQTDDDELEGLGSIRADIVRNLGNVCVV